MSLKTLDYVSTHATVSIILFPPCHNDSLPRWNLLETLSELSALEGKDQGDLTVSKSVQLQLDFNSDKESHTCWGFSCAQVSGAAQGHFKLTPKEK